MQRKCGWIILSCLMALSLILASCATTVEEEEEEEEGPPVSGDWWDKFGEPEYGDTIAYGKPSLTVLWDVDSWRASGTNLQFEGLWHWSWTVDREEWPFDMYYVPDEYHDGWLAESWEMPDLQTVIVKIREGIHWQDKPPVNGREFTAHDVEYRYDRLLGAGSGFTEPEVMHLGRTGSLEKVTATGKYKLEMKFSEPNAWGFQILLEDSAQNYIMAPEMVKPPGESNADWTVAVGTGPWIITDYIESSSLTWSRNPNYWGYDERHPENQLPYADTLKTLIIPDLATRLAALRTGKVDMLDNIDWEQAGSLENTNPELLQAAMPRPGPTMSINTNATPYNDIKVRKAMQLAIDRQTLAETLFGGTVDATPCGIIHPAYGSEYCFLYEDWPQELKDEYSYNPERARELLAEAGYPNSFKDSCQISGNTGLDFLEAMCYQLSEIGADIEIKVVEPAAGNAALAAGQVNAYFQYQGRSGMGSGPNFAINMHYSTNSGQHYFVTDPALDAIVDDFDVATTLEEAKRLLVAGDRYNIENHTEIYTFSTIAYNIIQPYLKGYSGEIQPRNPGWLFARLWIDHDMKESMGR